MENDNIYPKIQISVSQIGQYLIDKIDLHDKKSKLIHIPISAMDFSSESTNSKIGEAINKCFFEWHKKIFLEHPHINVILPEKIDSNFELASKLIVLFVKTKNTALISAIDFLLDLSANDSPEVKDYRDTTWKELKKKILAWADEML